MSYSFLEKKTQQNYYGYMLIILILFLIRLNEFKLSFWLNLKLQILGFKEMCVEQDKGKMLCLKILQSIKMLNSN